MIHLTHCPSTPGKFNVWVARELARRLALNQNHGATALWRPFRPAFLRYGICFVLNQGDGPALMNLSSGRVLGANPDGSFQTSPRLWTYTTNNRRPRSASGVVSPSAPGRSIVITFRKFVGRYCCTLKIQKALNNAATCYSGANL